MLYRNITYAFILCILATFISMVVDGGTAMFLLAMFIHLIGFGALTALAFVLDKTTSIHLMVNHAISTVAGCITVLIIQLNIIGISFQEMLSKAASDNKIWWLTGLFLLPNLAVIVYSFGVWYQSPNENDPS